MSESLHICHGCDQMKLRWSLRPAQVNVGKLNGWQAMLCQECTSNLELFITTALKKAREAKP